MNTSEVTTLARELMNFHGLSHWTFEIDRAKRRAGYCKHSRTTISLSGFYILLNNETEIKDTILHEIAHALAGPGNGHNHVWKAICRRIGAKPVRCYGNHVSMPKGRWKAKCNHCQKEYHRHRKPKDLSRYHCTTCGSTVGKLQFSQVKI